MKFKFFIIIKNDSQYLQVFAQQAFIDYSGNPCQICINHLSYQLVILRYYWYWDLLHSNSCVAESIIIKHKKLRSLLSLIPSIMHTLMHLVHDVLKGTNADLLAESIMFWSFWNDWFGITCMNACVFMWQCDNLSKTFY